MQDDLLRFVQISYLSGRGLEHTRRNGHLPDLLELAMTTHTRDTEKAVQKAISRATPQLGDTELRPKQDLVIGVSLRGKGVFICFPTSVACCWRGSRPPPSAVQLFVSLLVFLAVKRGQ